MKRLLTIIILLVATSVYGATLTWDANSESDLAGYRLYYDDKVIDIDATETSIVALYTIDGYYTLTAYDTEGYESRHTDAVFLARYYYNSTKYDFSSYGLVLYKGEHVEQDAVDSDTGWVVTKYYYNASGMIIQQRTRTTSWTNRAVGW